MEEEEHIFVQNARDKPMKYSLVIPIFNEEDVINVFHQRLENVLKAQDRDYEIIYVDDASTDASLDILKDLSKQGLQVRIISFKENRGQSTALFAGFRLASGEWIITLDADLQNPPEEIPKLLEFKNDFDFITGVRERRKDSILRKTSSSIAKTFRFVILGDRTQDTGCALRIFKREVVSQIPFFRNFHRFFTFLVRKRGFKVKEVSIRHEERKFGKSKYKTFNRACEGIFDLIGVFWLKRRMINYEVKYER